MEQKDLLWVSVGRDGILSPHHWEPNCPITCAGYQVGGHRPIDQFPRRACEGSWVVLVVELYSLSK